MFPLVGYFVIFYLSCKYPFVFQYFCLIVSRPSLSPIFYLHPFSPGAVYPQDVLKKNLPKNDFIHLLKISPYPVCVKNMLKHQLVFKTTLMLPRKKIVYLSKSTYIYILMIKLYPPYFHFSFFLNPDEKIWGKKYPG